MFESLYNYFKTRKILLIVIILSIFSFAVYKALQIKTIEDISKIIPSDNELKRFNFATKHIKFNDRIIVHVSAAKKDSIVNPEKLIKFSDSLTSLLEKKYPQYISEIKNTVSENVMNDVYSIFNENLPIFLEENDYNKIDKLLLENEINKTLEADLKTLISPASLVIKKFITKDPLSITPLALKKLNKLQFDDNYEIYNNHILTKDKKSLLLFVTSKFSNDETGKNLQLIEALNETISETKNKFQNIDAEIFGAPVISAGNAQRIKQDIILTVSIALISLFLFLSFFFKRIEIFFVIFLPAVFGATVSIAIINFLQSEVSAISIGVGSILVGISIDYSLHIFTHFRSKTDASKIFKDITLPILMSSLTTASAFFCLLFVSSEALQDLGLFAGISVLSSALFALIVLPHFLRKKKSKDGKIKTENNFIERFASYNFHKNKYLLFNLLAFTTFSLFFFNNSDFESDMDKMNYMSPELKQAEKNIENISNDALRKMFFVVTGKNLNDALLKNDKLAYELNQLKNEGSVKQISSVNLFLLSDSLQKQRIKTWEKFWTQEKIAKLENNLNKYGKNYGFKENAFANFISSLKKKYSILGNEKQNKLIELFGNDLVNKKDSLTSIVSLIKLQQTDKKNIYNSISLDDDVYIVDKKYITDYVVSILKKDFNLLVIISLSVVFLILLIYFGRIELTLITITPMIVSWIWTLTIMWIFGLKFTIFNIIISTFIFGLGIDYSIFITQGLLQKYRYAENNLPSFKTSVLLSAITTITSIGVLIFAKHPAMRSIAFLSVIGITSVVFITYTLQPLLFNFLIKQQGKKRSLPITLKDLVSSLAVFVTFLIGAIFTTIIYALMMLIPFGRKTKKTILHIWLKLVSKAIVYIPINIKKIINNPYKETFKRPSVIIANHQAHIDITLLLMLHSKLLILTNDWVQNNIFYGRIVKFADFLPTSNGFEKNKKILKEKIKEGYSILIFPEGTRSKDLEIKRFHKGAFEYAKELGLDVLPIIIQGAGDCIPKGEPFLKSGQVSINILNRISIDNFGENSREQAKNIRAFMQKEYEKIRSKYETPKYFRRKLILNYIYKTPVVEHYTRVKTMFEKNYLFFDNMIPKKAQITDIGTGYGYLPYMLNFTSKERSITGIDYDCTKINTAKNNISKNENINFICGDALEIDFPESDIITILDVLHYMPKEKQKQLIIRSIEKLKPNGKIIIRDGNSEMEKKHKGTKLTEYFSTKLFKFNKTEYKQLHFTSKNEILEIVKPYNLEVKIVDETKFTSNIVFVLKKL